MNAWANSILLAIASAVMMMASLLPVSGLLGQFSLCHAALMGAGAYGAALTAIALPFRGTPLFDLIRLLLSLLIGGLFGMLAGALCGLPSLRLRGEHFTISTLAFGQVLYALFFNLRPLGGYGLSKGTAGQSLVGIDRLIGGMPACLLAFSALFMICRLKESRFGRALRIVKNDETAACVVGIRVPILRLLCFLCSGFLAGLAGGIAACGIGTVTPASFSYARSAEYAMAATLSADLPIAALLVGIVFALLPELLGRFASYRMLLYALCVFFAVLIKNHKKGESIERSLHK